MYSKRFRQSKVWVLSFAKLFFNILALGRLAFNGRTSTSSRVTQVHYIKSNKRVLVACSTFGNIKTAKIDILIARLLSRYGYNIDFLVCSSELEACAMCEVELQDRLSLDAHSCKSIQCFGCSKASGIYSLTESPSIRIIQYPAPAEDAMQQISYFLHIYKSKKVKEPFKGTNVHEHAIAGLVRYLGRSISYCEIERDALLLDEYCRFLYSALYIVESLAVLLGKEKYCRAVVNHGLYVPQGVIIEVCRKYIVPSTVWHLGYRINTIVFSYGETYHKTLVNDTCAEILKVPLTRTEEDELTLYLGSRRTGSMDQISFVHRTGNSKQRHRNNIKPNNFSKNILVLTNVGWDAQCHYSHNVYGSMNDWIIHLIAAARVTPSYNYIFRIHPAEVTGRRVSSVSTADFIAAQKDLPNNILIIPPEDTTSTYSLIDSADGVIVYATKTAVEAAVYGKPVLVCGESCARNKGFTVDLEQKDDLLDRIQYMLYHFDFSVDSARRYAHYLFFKLMQDWNSVNTEENDPDNDFRICKVLVGD